MFTEVSTRQSFAITNALDQKSEIQPIGRVGEKIEGFFAACRNRGLTGDRGVIIPKLNRKNLLLKKGVVDAVKTGKFRATRSRP